MKECAVCKQDIEEGYYTYQDNFLQAKFFDEMDGSDNIFCSPECAGQALMLTWVPNEDYEKEQAERLGLTEEEKEMWNEENL